MPVAVFLAAASIAILARSQTVVAAWQDGFLSALSSFIGSENVSAKVSPSFDSNGSQTIALLQGPANADVASASPEVLPIDSGGALVPDIAAAEAADSNLPANTQISAYVVRDGDTVSSVAKMFKVSVNTVLWANDLSSRSVLRPGQTLVILPISGISYTVKKGDSLQSIAKKFSADVTDILNYNDLTLSSTLSAGAQIIIPAGEMSAADLAQAGSAANRGRQSGLREPLLDNVSALPAYPGYYLRPIAGGRESQGLHGHNAVDLAAPVGTPILASAAGTVIIDRQNGAWNGGYGNYVVISHANGTQTLYAHMLNSAVASGEQVDQGQIIGYIGMTGLTTGPHVHFEIRGAKNPF